MPIFHAIGIGVLILVLKFLTPQILAAGEQTAIAFLHGATVSAVAATDIAAHAGSIPLPNTLSPSSP